MLAGSKKRSSKHYNSLFCNYFKIAFFIIFTIISHVNTSAQQKFDTELLLEYKKNGPAISAMLNRIEVYKYVDTSAKCIYLKNGFRSSKFLNEADWLSIKDSVEPYRIDIVYSKYPLRNGVYKEIYSLLLNRIKSIINMDPNLNDPEIEWNTVLQTDCLSDQQVNKLFHGVVIWYKNISLSDEQSEDEVSNKFKIIQSEKAKLVSEQNSLEELTESVESIKSFSFIPDSLKESLNKQSLDVQIKTIKKFLEEEISKEPNVDLAKASPKELKMYKNEVDDFLNRFKVHDSVVSAVFNRHPEWKNILVVNDWTGSMYGYGAQILQWHLNNFEKSGIISLTLFNDGDSKDTKVKRVGSTEGIYCEKADNITKLIKMFNYIMLKGSGGDGPENDIEGILKAMEVYPYYSEIVLIADNNACVRDIELADRIGKPVKVIICGYNKSQGINPDFVYLAKKTGGGVYTIENDLENIEVELSSKGEIASLQDKRFKLISKKCGSEISIEREDILDYKYGRFHKRRIRMLNLSNKNLSSVPNGVYRMKKLNYLDLSRNKLTELEYKISNLEYLKTLNLSKNKLSSLPRSILAVHFIEKIDLSDNQFKAIPNEISGMKFLLSIDLSNNQINAFDKKINTPKLSDLNLSNNKITDLSKAISSLRGLKKLNLSNNLIEILPNTILNLSKLEQLNLSNNNLTLMPVQLSRLKKLKVLRLEGNNFSEEEKTRIKNILPNTDIYF